VSTKSLGDLMNEDEITALVERSRNYDDHECGMPKEDAVKIIQATLRVFACRPDSFSFMYAWDAFAEAIGEKRANTVLRVLEHQKLRALKGDTPQMTDKEAEIARQGAAAIHRG
jgi:hypothetical protein